MVEDAIADVVMAAATFFRDFRRRGAERTTSASHTSASSTALLGARRHSCLHIIALHFKIINASRSVSHSHIDTMV